MHITAQKVAYAEIEQLREMYRAEAKCQIVSDSALRRSLADGYLLELNGRCAGYGAVWNKHHPNRILEFYTMPHLRQSESALFRALIEASGATHSQAQTNMPRMLTMLYDNCTHIAIENILFEDGLKTHLECRGEFRKSGAGDGKDPNEWVLEIDCAIAAWGGVLFHYNPPYGDIYMEVAEDYRRLGYGSFLVQELKRVAYESGHVPAARCNPKNTASRLTLQRAGMQVCGRMLAGKLTL